jgi:hypothetical protein
MYERRTMMKKLLVLTLVLGIASLATASIQLGIGGNTDLIDSEIWLDPSQEIVFDVIASGEEYGMPIFVNIMMMDGAGTMAPLTNYVIPYDPEDPMTELDVTFPALIPGEVYLLDTIIPGPTPNPIQGLLGDFVFHCAGPGDVLIMLGFDVYDASLDQLIVHQTPEPATMALLGLGALVLRRKK